ncbi:MAG TPA: hypothetical protein P5526_27080 [Anaerolineae bacterium]|nr:hypothetical protein [Anaerolineae bacterium]MCB0179741.1 hypothetical protein [Anaerolineae bacterium]MCB0222317.1 hypothetical protein [Anaerolineae bacterium]HRV95848.1 hypothetical protein [Anaerolineae bacterium]
MLSQLFTRFCGAICLLGILVGSFMSLAYADTIFLPIIIKSSSSDGGGGGGNCPSGNLLQDSSFETGSPYWTQLAGSYPIIQTFGNALDGTKVAWFGGYNNANDRLSSQPFTVPAGCTQLTITVHVNLYTQEISSFPYDNFYASLQPVGSVTNPEIKVVDNTDDCPTCAWLRLTYTYNQIPNPGQPLRLYFHGTTDNSRYTNFRLDVVSVEGSRSASIQTATTAPNSDHAGFIIESTLDQSDIASPISAVGKE